MKQKVYLLYLQEQLKDFTNKTQERQLKSQKFQLKQATALQSVRQLYQNIEGKSIKFERFLGQTWLQFGLWNQYYD